MTGGAPNVPAGLLEREAERICARYRVSAEQALDALRRAFAARPRLFRRICERHEVEDVTRWREYRDVVKQCRKRVYYELRRYYAAPEAADDLAAALGRAAERGRTAADVEELRRALLEAHVSTRERAPHVAEFHARVFELCGVPVSVLDLGCGMHPLSYPFATGGQGTRLYVAVDTDARAVRAVSAFGRLLAAPERLVAVQLSLGDPAWTTRLPGGGVFELAFMLKLVPVLSRLDSGAAAALGAVPAGRLLVTGSAESMTRRETIEARERRVLERFLRGAGRDVVAQLRVGNEFGYLAE